MPQHLRRREFIQASAAVAGAITAAGLAGTARAAAWATIDAQVHAYERNHPGRPWAGTLVGPEEMTDDQMVAAMDAVGVDGAVLVSPFSMYRYDASYVLEVQAKHPDRFCLVKPVDPNDPAVADIVADWKAKKGTVGVRVIMRENVSADPADPGVNRVLAAAAKHSMAVNLLCWGRLEQAGQLAARNPNTRLVIDHLGLQQPFKPPPPAQPRGRLAEGARGRGLSQCRRQDHRRLHAVSRTVPVPGHLGPARPHLRCLWPRPLHVGHRLDTRGQITDLRRGCRCVSPRPAVR